MDPIRLRYNGLVLSDDDDMMRAEEGVRVITNIRTSAKRTFFSMEPTIKHDL